MLAVYAAAVGGDDPMGNLVVGEQPEPTLRPGWALVRVAAASINHHDLWTLRGVSSAPVELPHILGTDVAGTVERYAAEPPPGAPPVGSPVLCHSIITDGTCPACRRGDELLCRTANLLSDASQGTFAELVPVPVANLLPRPEGLSPVAAACLPTAWLTAYRMLFTRARVRPGDTVLIQGASGGVATAAVQLCAATGVRSLVTSRSAAKGAAAVRLGAAQAVTLDREGAKLVRGFTGGEGVDAVLDTVGEPTMEFSLRAARPGGSVVVSGGTGGRTASLSLPRLFWFQLSLLGSTMGTRAELERLVALVGEKHIVPAIDSVVPFAEAPAAFRRVAAGEHFGKVVLIPR